MIISLSVIIHTGCSKKVIPLYFANFLATALNFSNELYSYVLCSYCHTIAKYFFIILKFDKSYVTSNATASPRF